MAAGTTIGALRVVIGADTGGLSRGLKEAEGGLKGVGRSAADVAKRLAVVGAAFTAAAGALAMLVRSEANLIASQAKLARSINGTITGWRTLKMATEDNGIDGMEASLNRLNRRLGAAAMGTGPAIHAVEALGLNLKAIAEMDADERMALIADRIRDSGMSAQEAARHLQNLGFQQREAVTFFMQGGDAIRAARQEVERYGLAVDEASAAKLEDITTQWTRIGTAMAGIRTQLTVALLPLLEAAGNFAEGAARGIAKITPHISKIIDYFKQAAEAIGVATLALAGFYAPAVLAGLSSVTGGVLAFATAVRVQAVGAMRALTAAVIANPIGALIAALVAAGYAAYKFRDRIKDAIGVDVVDIAKTAANTVISSFVAAYEDIKFVWNNFGDMMGAAVVGGINVAIRAINGLIEGALSGINSLIDAVNKIPGVDIGRIGDSAKIDLLDNEYASRLIDAVTERNRKIAEIMSTDRFAGSGAGEPGTGEDIDPDDPWTPPALGIGGGGAAENVAKETEAIRERLLERLEMFREMLASEQELEILKHEQQLEQLQELWEEGIIPTEAEYMEMLEELEARHQDRLTEMQEKGEAERLALIEKAAQMETQARRAALQEAVGFLDQLSGESKAAAIASIALNKGLAVAQIIQNTAAAQMRALAELGPIAGPPVAAKIGVMGKVQAGIAAAAGLAQAASVSSRGTSGLQGGASGSVGGRSSAPSSGGMGSTGGGSGGPRVNINLIEDRDRAGQVDVNRSDDEEVDADVFVADIRGGGPRAQALQETFNLRRVGS